MTERTYSSRKFASRQELALRASDILPFVDMQAVRGAIRTVMGSMHSIKHREGTVVYPYSLSDKEIGQLRKHLRKHNTGLERRIDAIVPTRLAEGMGTAFLIRAKK